MLIERWVERLSKMQTISEFYLNMKLLDASGYYTGRVIEFIGSGRMKVRRREGDVSEKVIAEAKRYVWFCDPTDPAVLGKWKSSSDVPTPTPGLSWNDGYELGQLEGRGMADFFQEAPQWLAEPPGEAEPSGDDFTDGYLSGYMEANRERLLERFPEGPVIPEPHWTNRRWGIDPDDSVAQAEFKRGAELAEKQSGWMTEIEADRIVNRMCLTIPFRFGFKSRMEEKFGKRWH